ncbi:MAG: hypothetical protein LBR36_00260 [Bacteroidales bacterium]|nr:hypothetical protein [Bacteroidales bacterium]
MKKIVLFMLLLLNVNAFSQEKWFAEIELPDLGKFEFFTTKIAISDVDFVLKSASDRDKIFLGTLKAKFLRTLQKREYKESIVALEIIENSGKLHSLFGTFSLDSVIATENYVKATVIFGDESFGTFIARKIDGEQEKMNYYEFIFNNLQKITERNIFNPNLVKTKNWTKFIGKMQAKIPLVDDDLDFMLLFFANAGNVGFSHFSLLKTDIDLERTLSENQIEATEVNDSVILLKFNTLSGRISEIDSVFNRYKHGKIFILDFRKMPGGLLKNACETASMLIKDTISGGNFATRLCYESENCISDDFYVLENFDYESFTRILQKEKGVKIRLSPNEKVHIPELKKIYILVDSKTASAGEPLVLGLQKSGNALVVGETTAGQVLSPKIFDIGGGFYAAIPIAEYVTDTGERIEGKGVVPSVKIKSKKALEWVYNDLKIGNTQ